MSAEGLQKLIDKCPKNQSMAEHLRSQFLRINGFKLRLSSARLRSAAIKKKYDEEIMEIQKQIDFVRSECRHESTTHHSCTEDSYTDCDICGKTL